ncbi:MAG: spermidine synthase [Candidatus Lindowbacteria bacterium RIFCSPLOWO2_12_FULL_62_27]|nr:MAG: spermidine synthase [Candidatus Lindowbacteria bacterium RIFCSPLOWO2_02_FULL_62_12]OGH60270.1 MAG: spermidine synthase [Candidatus Lindowbacteria bacterium RIFCSPLOWO2_12_FULL_62_27]
MARFSENARYSPVIFSYDIERVLYRHKSKYQKIMVAEHKYFGRMLILDDAVQITERDEFFYHEMLTHVVMHAHPAPRRIIVIGGGDGGIVREVLKHRTVEKVFFAELDGEVIDVSRRFFPKVAGRVDDDKVEIHVGDGAAFLRDGKPENIDAVIVDSTNITGIANTLFTDNFFKLVKHCLSADGFFVTHTESMHFHKKTIIAMQRKLKRHFPIVDLYTAPIATYPSNWWSFAVASRKWTPRKMRRRHSVKTKFYSAEIHAHAFLPPRMYGKLLRNQLEW